MNISEGISCAFQQQVVSIDAKSNEMVTLGSIAKTIVATPDLEKGFATC
jgi:hypothetical protein